MTPAEEAALELQAVKSAFATLRKLGYQYCGGQYWEPPPETQTEEQALTKPGWYMVWQLKNGKKSSSDTYALVTREGAQPVLYFTLNGKQKSKPVPFGDQPYGYEVLRCAPNFQEVLL